jgi:hypothetical protein
VGDGAVGLLGILSAKQSLPTLVWERKINPGKVFDLTLPLDQVAEGYRAMDERSVPRRRGDAYGTPTWIWSVAVGDALYVRAYNGGSSRSYKAAMRQKAGRITAAHSDVSGR